MEILTTSSVKRGKKEGRGRGHLLISGSKTKDHQELGNCICRHNLLHDSMHRIRMNGFLTISDNYLETIT